MAEKYAILDATHGHLVNVVLWDGDADKWQPPVGTNAVKLADVDLSSLPPAPAPEAPTFTAEGWVAQHLSPLQVAALGEFRLALLSAGKPLGPNMTALKTWLETMMAASVDPTPRTFSEPPCDYVAASSEALAAMSQQ